MKRSRERRSAGDRPHAADGPAAVSWVVRHGALLCAVAALLFVAAVRLRVAGVPLERDEGEYAYAGRLILQGIPPYRLVYNMKLPGTYYAYAAILAALGSTPRAIHLGLAAVNAGTLLLLFLLARRLLGEIPAAAAATGFALLSLDRSLLGVFAHATHFVLFPALAGLLLLLWALDSRRLAGFLGSGVLLGVAVLMKQHAVLFLALAAGLVAWRELREEGSRPGRGVATRIGALAAGAVLPLALVAAVLLAQGVLGRCWFWTFGYAREYVTEEPLSRALPALAEALRDATQTTRVWWIAAAVGFALIGLRAWRAEARLFVAGLLGASFLAVCPGFLFRAHYFILMLPAVALLAGMMVGAVAELAAGAGRGVVRAVAAAAILMLAAAYVIPERAYLFSMSPRELSRTRYGANPFVEAVEVGRYLRERTTKDDRIAVLGSEPEIYFYADRLSATGYVYTYPLMEAQRYASQMQREMMREIEAVHPKYVVFVQIYTSWLGRPGSDQTIVQWWSRYAQACYDLVGIADIYSLETTGFAWDAEVRQYRPASNNLLLTFRRRGDAPCSAGPAP